MRPTLLWMVCLAAAFGAQSFVPIEQRTLGMPVQNMKLSDLRDTFNEARGGERRHEATDIVAARGTPVLAAEDGTIRKLFLSKPGGITIYEFDNSEHYCYYYAHLDHYAANLKEGMRVNKGDIIGYVGTTGNVPPGSPHLHFGITLVGPDKKWWGARPSIRSRCCAILFHGRIRRPATERRSQQVCDQDGGAKHMNLTAALIAGAVTVYVILPVGHPLLPKAGPDGNALGVCPVTPQTKPLEPACRSVWPGRARTIGVAVHIDRDGRPCSRRS